MQNHRYSFFGQKTAVIFQSGDWSDPWSFLTFIKKRETGLWEKTADGKTIKLSLPEIVALKDVVAGDKSEWKTFHKSASTGAGTAISARRETGKDGTNILIAAGDYLRLISYPETSIFLSLLQHVFEEKIAHATTPTAKPTSDESFPEEYPAQEPEETPKFTPEPSIAEMFAKLHLPPLPQRLPLNTFPVHGTLTGVRTAGDQATLFVTLASGSVEEIAATTVVGAGMKGPEVDLVVNAPALPPTDKPSPDGEKPAKPAAKRTKAMKKPGNVSESPSIPSTNPAISATPTSSDSIKAASVKKVTDKALLLLNADGAELWIPKSALAEHVAAPASPQEAAWPFAVKSWFAQKPDFQNWVKSS